TPALVITNGPSWAYPGAQKKPRSPGKMKKVVMEQVKTKSVEPHTRFALPEVNWDELNEPGAYVERGSGDLYRVPKEPIIPGGSPIIHKERVPEPFTMPDGAAAHVPLLLAAGSRTGIIALASFR